VSGVGALLTALSVPTLTGAKCKGKHTIFDPPERGGVSRSQVMNQERALRMCRRCPCLAECRRFYDSLPARQRPTGVVAGRVIHSGPAVPASPGPERRNSMTNDETPPRIYPNVRASKARLGMWEARRPGGDGRGTVYLGTYKSPEEARYAVCLEQAEYLEAKAKVYRAEAELLQRANRAADG
jgi:hypothetical protein